MQNCGMHWQCCFCNAALAQYSIAWQHTLNSMNCAGTAALGASLWLPERAQADIDYKETVIGVNGLSTFQRAGQKADLAVRNIPSCHFAYEGSPAYVAAYLSALSSRLSCSPRKLQDRATRELKKVLKADDSGIALKALLHDAATYDVATGTGGVNGSICFE